MTIAPLAALTPANVPSGVSRPSDRATAEEQWAALAAGISGSGMARVSRDGGRTYPTRYQRRIDQDLPNQPAAVLIYDASGSARTLCVDLDVSRGGIDAVARDLRAVEAILSRVGMRFFADRSPNGGVHVYVPLAEPAPFHTAAAVARALAARTPTMDPMPMLGISSGCIRPPGSRHKSGGHQMLIGSLNHAYDVLRRPNDHRSWEQLLVELDVDQHGQVDPTSANGHDVERLDVARREPDAGYQHIARTGNFDTDRYRSPSEARQAVIWACVASGWEFRDLARRLHDGTWPGLAAMYGRYRPNHRHQALVRDWRSALKFEKSRRETTQDGFVRVRPTSRPETHGGQGEYRFIRSWLNAVRLTHYVTERDALGERAVLHALAEAAMKQGSSMVEFGNRSLAIATGLDQRTVGRVLRDLENSERPLITLTRPAHGVRANAWTLIIPEDLAEQAASLQWRRGKVHGIRPVFRELGLVAAFVYGALEQALEPSSGRTLADSAGVGHTSAYEALETLAAFDLAVRTRSGWILGAGNLDQLAEMFGVVEAIQRQIAKYRTEREQWWAWLGVTRFPRQQGVGARSGASPPSWDVDPPPEPGWTVMDLLHAELGAYVIEEAAAS